MLLLIEHIRRSNRGFDDFQEGAGRARSRRTRSDAALVRRPTMSRPRHGDAVLVLDHETPPLHLHVRGGDADLADCGDSRHKSLLLELSRVVKK